ATGSAEVVAVDLEPPVNRRSLNDNNNNGRSRLSAARFFTKRVCLEAELQAAECPMETTRSFPVINQREEQQVSGGRHDDRRSEPDLRCVPGVSEENQ
ncbi:hypothetical protein INR49_020679, partial [Caranx melampygus]